MWLQRLVNCAPKLLNDALANPLGPLCGRHDHLGVAKI